MRSSTPALGGPNQSWTLSPVHGDYNVVTLRNHNSWKCLEVADWRKDNGAPVRQWECTGGANQQWYRWLYNGGYAFINVNSGQCLEVADWSTANGAAVRQWTCGGGPQGNQMWYVW
ncbi:RICIN domain-containing protein [Streptomyces echinatus]|uniref:RICIN domain-containing protein n=1 Tax=Streptomyces echinatus TaxID=67293 RepID=UPI00380A154B